MYMRNLKSLATTMFIAIILYMLIIPTVMARADTDENTLHITAQPDRLVLRLGSEWAGAEFELRFDTYVFPIPVVADADGVIAMDLGGSSTYTLTLLDRPALPQQPQAPSQSAQENPYESADETNDEQPDEHNRQENYAAPSTATNLMPPATLILFFGGLGLAVGALILMRAKKRRNVNNDDYPEDEYDDEY